MALYARAFGAEQTVLMSDEPEGDMLSDSSVSLIVFLDSLKDRYGVRWDLMCEI